MERKSPLTEQFEQHRPWLRGVAYRMLGSLSDAEDAVQETWLRLHRVDATTVENLRSWLTAVVSRVCLDLLRSRKSRREESIGSEVAEQTAARGAGADPEAEAVLADATGVALLVLLDTLTAAERLAFVLHDLFAMPFDEIGPILGRSAAASKQLASRARRRVRGASAPADEGKARQAVLVATFLRAARAGDLESLLAVLDPEAVIHIDAAARVHDPHATNPGTPREVRGAATWARQLIAFARGMRFVQAALVDGSVGLVLAPGGKLSRVMAFTFAGDRVARVEVIGDPARLRSLDLAVPAEPSA